MIEQRIDEQEEASFGSFFSHIPTALWERRWWIIIPTLIGVAAAAAALTLIKPLYQSSALMLVQSAQLPGEILGQADGEVVDRRIARIRQQITSRPDLITLIQRHNLYPEERESQPLSGIVRKMRDSITLTPTSVDQPGVQADQRTIAFSLAFDYHNPVLAQAVAQDLMDKLLELDAAGNVGQAATTEQFLEEQAAGLEEQIRTIEGQISDVNARYGGILANGVPVIANSGSYDVQIAALQRDNANLIIQKRNAQSADARAPAVAAAETALASARAVYAESHPDVVMARQRLAEARELAKTQNQNLPLNSIDQQIDFNNSQIAALRAAKASAEAQTNAQLAAQAQTPLVQQQVQSLQQRLAGLNQQYQSVQGRLMAARAGVRAEDEQLSERLAVVEPPIIPDRAFFPDRLLIVLLGLGGGFGFGILLALGLELLLRPIRDSDALAALTGMRPLGVVPIIQARARSTKGWTRFLPNKAAQR